MANYETIHKPVEKGDLADVKRHLQQGADVNEWDKDSQTPPMGTARAGEREVIKILVDAGAVNERDNGIWKWLKSLWTLVRM